MTRAVIEARNLTKTFPGGIVAVSGLDLAIEPGVVYGLMGRNGAGKTTTLRLLMGLLRADQGTALILGEEMWKMGQSSRARAGYVSQSQQLPGWMTLLDLCRYTRSFYPKWDQDFAVDLARRWNLPSDRPLSALSGGEQRKAALLAALAPRPEVLLLDEPAAGLDPISRRQFIDEIVGLLTRGEGCTVILSTHIITDMERVADWIGILDRGRLLLSRSLDDLKASYRRVQVIFPGSAPPPRFAIPGALECQVDGPVMTAMTANFDAEQMEALKQWPGVRVQVFPLGLEEIFIQVAGQPASRNPEIAWFGAENEEITLERKWL